MILLEIYHIILILIVATKALLTSILLWIFLAHFTLVLDQFLVRASLTWKIVSLILPHSGLLYGLVAFTSHRHLGKLVALIYKSHSYLDVRQICINGCIRL